MALIDKSYFVFDISLPGGTYTDLDTFVARYEPEILKLLLGYELYDLMINDQSNEPYKSLIEGAEYTVSYNGRSQKVKWNGLKNSDKVSLVAYYVYYWYNRAKASTSNNVGETKSKQENSFNASQAAKTMNAWNRLEELYGCSGQNILVPSAYNYLIENESDFPSWVFTEIGSINSHDL